MNQIVGIGFILHISDIILFHFKGNQGSKTNNRGEFMALFYLLKLALDRGLRNLQVFGDSRVFISWMNNQYH